MALNTRSNLLSLNTVMSMVDGLRFRVIFYPLILLYGQRSLWRKNVAAQALFAYDSRVTSLRNIILYGRPEIRIPSGRASILR